MNRQTWPIIALVFVSLSGFAGWQWYEERFPSWREEVQLSDGRVLKIAQKRKYFKGYGTDQSWVKFSLPESGGERTWHSHLEPMRLDVHDGKVYVFGRPRGPKQFAYYGYPKHFVAAFVWDGGGFRRIRFNELPEQVRKEENILTCIDFRGEKFISLASKNVRWCPPVGDSKQLTKYINWAAYMKLAEGYAHLDGGHASSD